MFKMEIDTSEVEKAIESISIALSSPQAFEEVAPLLINFVTKYLGDKFKNEQDPTGGGWTPISPVTLKFRKWKGINHSHLGIETGELYRAVLGQSGAIFEAIVNPSDQSIILRLKGDKATWFEREFQSRNHHHPAREYWHLTPEMMQTMADEIVKGSYEILIQRAINRAL